MVEQLDVSTYTTASGAAKAVGETIKEIAREMDQDPELEVMIKENDDHWLVSWPGGPFDWAPRLTGGTPVWASADPEIVGFIDNNDVDIECKSRDTLVFYD